MTHTKKTSRLHCYCLLFAGFLAVASCSSEKKALIRKRKTERKLNKVGFEAFEYDALTIKSKLEFDVEGDERKARAYMRIRKDSAIWISISKTTVEGLRILVTPDTVMAINRIDKVFYSYNYPQLQEKYNFPFDYKMLQSALTGEPYFPEGSKPSKRPVGDGYLLRDRIAELLVKQFIGGENHKLQEVLAQDSKGRELKIEYGNFEEVEGQLFPHKNRIGISYTQDGAEKKTTLNFEYTRVNLAEKDLKIPFKVNDKYEEAE